LNFNHAFVILYSNQTDKEIKEIAFSFIGSSQAHLTKLQSQCNVLVYRKQRREFNLNMAIAGIALFVTVILGIISIIISIP
jgi:hypothetical protein